MKLIIIVITVLIGCFIVSDAELPKNTDTGFTVSPGTTYPSTFSTPLDYVNPDSVLSGTNRGIQNLGSPSLYADGGNNRIVAAPNNNPSVLMGNQPTFGNGFYVAKPGVNAITNTDPSQFIFNSNQDVFKIVGTGTANITVTGSGIFSVSVPHGLSYTPVALVYSSNSGSFYQLPSIFYYSVSTSILVHAYADFDTTSTSLDIRMSCDSSYFSTILGSVSTTIPFKYYLLQETAN